MKWEILKGSKKDFEGVAEDVIYVLGTLGSKFYSADMLVTKCGVAILESDKKYIIAERRPIAEPDPRQSTEWNGEGLPPVGVECEMSCASYGWVKCVLIAHGDEQIIFKQDGCREVSGHRRYYTFRPIRSPVGGR